MSIVIIGAGAMGYHLARRLSFEKQDVTVIDQNEERVGYVLDTLDVRAIVGRGSSPDVLRQAGLEKAGIMVAVTDSDEVNLVACYMGGLLNGVMKKVARLRSEDFHAMPELFDERHLGLDLVINPEREAVNKLIEIMQVPAATDVINFAEGRIKLFGVRLNGSSPFVGQSLENLRTSYPDERILIPVIFRDSEVVIPRGHDVIKANDTIYVIATSEAVARVTEMSGLSSAPMRRFMIYGGTTAGVMLAKALEDRSVSNVKLVDANRSACENIASQLNETMVLCTDAVDEGFLRSEGIATTDAFLAVTDDDEINALSALLAKRMGARRVAALTDRLEYHRLLGTIGIDIVVNPRLAGASRILQFIRKGKVMSVSMLPGEGVEAIEFEAMETSQLVGKPLRKVRFPSGAILGGVERGREFFIPHGETVIHPGDRIVVFARLEAVPKVEKLVTVGLDFFR